jgi:predicted kinase
MERPRLIILIAPPGAGKSTYAQKYITRHQNTIHVSSDSIRKRLYGSEETQGDPTEVFGTMQKDAVEALREGQSVVYDATNMTRRDRADIIAAAPKFTQIEAHIVWASIEECIERDANRNRTVGKAVIDKMLKRFQAPWYDEGFDDIVVYHDPFAQLNYVANCTRAMRIPHDNPHHTFGVYEHCDSAEKFAMDNKYNDNIVWAAKWHDVGKPYVKAFVDGNGNPSEGAHYYQHHCVGAWMAYGLFNCTPYRSWLISVHMDPFMNTKYYRNMHPALKRDIDALHNCDLNAH